MKSGSRLADILVIDAVITIRNEGVEEGGGGRGWMGKPMVGSITTDVTETT